MLSECVIKTLKYFFLNPATTRSKYRKKGQTQHNFHEISLALSSCALSFLLSLWLQAKWVAGRAGLPQWRLMFLTQHFPSHLQLSRPLKGRPALRSPDGWWGNLQEQLEEACVYSAPFNEEREGLSLAWISPGTRRRGKNKTQKKENERENGRSTCCSTSDHSSRFSTQERERGKGRREKMRERGLLCPCISTLLSALPSPDVAIAKPVGRRECVLGRGLAGLGGRRWWSNTWPSHKHEWPLQFNSSWCCLSHGAIKRGTGGFLSKL